MTEPLKAQLQRQRKQSSSSSSRNFFLTTHGTNSWHYFQ